MRTNFRRWGIAHDADATAAGMADERPTVRLCVHRERSVVISAGIDHQRGLCEITRTFTFLTKRESLRKKTNQNVHSKVLYISKHFGQKTVYNSVTLPRKRERKKRTFAFTRVAPVT